MRRHFWIGAIAIAAIPAITLSARLPPRSVAAPAPPSPSASPLGLVEGPTGLRSAGALAFAPSGTLLVGDSTSGSVYAIEVGEGAASSAQTPIEVEQVDLKIAALLGAPADQIVINDMAVQKASQDVYFSVTRGRGADAKPAVVRLRGGRFDLVPTDTARFAKISLTDAPAAGAKTSWGAEMRPMTITHVAYTDGRVYVAGLSNEAFASRLRVAPFPFGDQVSATSVEIFHTSHNRYETNAPIETFLPITIGGTPSLIAGYGCAPLAIFNVADLKPGAKVRGRTVAELGGGNRPLDLIQVEREGKPVVIVANSSRTLMR